MIEETAEDTAGSRLADGDAETRERIDETAGWSEAGRPGSLEANELKAGPTTTPPVEGAGVWPAIMADTANETLASSVAEGVASI
jgi:hypothetical protein